MDVQRRVASKRSRTKSGKTPRKSKLHRNEEKVTEDSGNKVHPLGSNGVSTNNDAWIDNSFGKNELIGNTTRHEGAVTTIPDITERLSAQNQGTVVGGLKTRRTPSRRSSRERHHDASHRHESPKSSKPDIFNNKTSTTRRSSSPEPYASYHDSFNESDTLFAELDIQKLPDLPQAGNRVKSNLSKNTPHRTLFEADGNTTYRTPHNVKTLSQVLNEHNYSPPDTGDDVPVVTSRSLKDKLKQAMKQNAKVATPQLVRQQQLRAESLQEAMKQAEEAKADGDECDIGPFYGLPSKVRKLLGDQRGITQLYDWQHECLTLKQVTQRQNLIYSLPTSGGKTLVAEILILKELLCRQKDAILILPFVSIVQEKVRGMSGFALDLEFFVEEYAAHKGTIPPRKRRNKKSLYVCTIEKANSVINSLIEAKRIEDIGLCVVDELHMLGEGGSRGATLEMSLAKLRHMNSDAHVVGMSATLSNIGDLATFLNAHVYTSDFRPVELTEYIKMEDVIYKVNNQSLVPEDRLVHDRHITFPYSTAEKKLDPDYLAALVQEVIPEHSCLVFCPTKKNCESVAELLCKMLPRSIIEHKKSEKKDLLTALWHEGGGEICPTLKKTIPFGIAYHHSGLTMDERKLVEEAYSEGILCLLCCTSTLAAGVNLPAKRVILRSPYVGIEFLSRSQYKQMTGRAGRAGIDTSGESILIVQRRDKTKVLSLATGPMEYCKSSLLYEGSKGMRQLLLTTVGLGITPTIESVVTFLRRTLCYVQSQQLGINDMETIATETLQQLLDLGLVVQTQLSQGFKSEVINSEEYLLEVSPLGKAVFKGSVECDRGPELYNDLKTASESLVVANYLHMLYLVTPYDVIGQVRPNWMLYLDELGSLDQAEIKVATLVGVSESYIARQISGQRTKKVVDQKVVSRFYLTLVLYNLWRQKTIWQVSAKFQLARGFIQNLLNSATSFASCVMHFCQELPEFWAYQELFSTFVKRLSYCHVADLIPLLEIPGVKIGRARQLHKAGYKSLQHIASADPEQLVKTIEHLPRKIAKLIVTSAQMVLQEKAEALMEEAQDIVSIPSDMPVDREAENSTSQQFSEELSVSFSKLL